MTDAERYERLQKKSRPGDKGKGKVGSSSVPQPKEVQATPPSRVPAPPSRTPGPPPPPQSSRQVERSEHRPARQREERAITAVEQPQRAPRGDSRPREVEHSEGIDPRVAVRQSFIAKFKDKLSLEVAGSSRSTDLATSMQHCIGKIVKVRHPVLGLLRLTFLGLLTCILSRRVCATPSPGSPRLGDTISGWLTS